MKTSIVIILLVLGGPILDAAARQARPARLGRRHRRILSRSTVTPRRSTSSAKRRFARGVRVPGPKYSIGVIRPNPNVKYTMPIAMPDPGVKYTILVINPYARRLSRRSSPRPNGPVRSRSK